MPKIAVFPGSFDPLTNGHVAIISRGLALFDKVVVAVTVNPRKTPLFSSQERVKLIEEAFLGEARLEVRILEGLLAPWARDLKAVAIIRGLRALQDFEYELQMAQMNRHLAPQLDTIFLPTEATGSYISSSLVKEVASFGGDVESLVPPHVNEALLGRFQKLVEPSGPGVEE